MNRIMGVKMDFEEMMKAINNKKRNEWIIAKLVCKKCSKIYEFSDRKKCNFCGEELEVVWDYMSNWAKLSK